MKLIKKYLNPSSPLPSYFNPKSKDFFNNGWRWVKKETVPSNEGGYIGPDNKPMDNPDNILVDSEGKPVSAKEYKAYYDDRMQQLNLYNQGLGDIVNGKFISNELGEVNVKGTAGDSEALRRNINDEIEAERRAMKNAPTATVNNDPSFKYQWSNQNDPEERKIRLNKIDNFIGLEYSAGNILGTMFKPLDITLPSKVFGGIKLYYNGKSVLDSFRYIFDDLNQGFLELNDATKKWGQEHPYVLFGINFAGDIAVPITFSGIKYGAQSLYPRIKYPNGFTVYHGTPYNFTLSEARPYSPLNLGLHVAKDPKTAKGFAEWPGEVKKFWLKRGKSDTLVLDLNDNGVFHIYNELPVVPEEETFLLINSPVKDELFNAARHEDTITLRKYLNSNGEWEHLYIITPAGEPGETLVLNPRSRFPKLEKNPEFRKRADEIVELAEKLLNEGDINKILETRKALMNLNKKTTELLDDAGYKVIEYLNTIEGKPGNICYMITNPQKELIELPKLKLPRLSDLVPLGINSTYVNSKSLSKRNK